MRPYLVLAIAACGHHVPTTLADGDRIVDAGGAHVAIHIRGSGPVCIVEPGGPGLEWTYLRMPSVERVATLVYVEPLGTGGSSRVDKAQLTLERHATDLEAVRTALALDKVCLIGHSYGGFVVQRYALGHADRVSLLVLYDASARADDELNQAIGAGVQVFAAQPWFADAMAAADAEDKATSDAELTAIFHREAPIMFADWTRRRAELEPALADVHAYVAASAGPEQVDARAGLRSLHLRALVIVGAHDAIMGPKFADELHAALAGSTLVVLPNSGHMGHLEEPDAFARAIRGAL